jgi:hypothetical protein
MECRLAGETEVLLGENPPQRHFCPSQNPTWPEPGLNPDRRGGMPATNRLSYGAAESVVSCTVMFSYFFFLLAAIYHSEIYSSRIITLPSIPGLFSHPGCIHTVKLSGHFGDLFNFVG